MIHPVVRWSAWLMPAVLAAVAVWAWCYDGPAIPAPRSGAAFIRHFIHYGLFEGYAAGSPRQPWTHAMPLDRLEPGDVILCGNPQAVYGEWSHATIYLGDGMVLTQDLLSGISRGPVRDLGWYDHVRVLRPRADPAVRARAARSAEAYIGQVFNLMAHPRDPRQWNCSRCVAGAYLVQGVTIADGRFWITPDALAATSGAVVWDS